MIHVILDGVTASLYRYVLIIHILCTEGLLQDQSIDELLQASI